MSTPMSSRTPPCSRSGREPACTSRGARSTTSSSGSRRCSRWSLSSRGNPRSRSARCAATGSSVPRPQTGNTLPLSAIRTATRRHARCRRALQSINRRARAARQPVATYRRSRSRKSDRSRNRASTRLAGGASGLACEAPGGAADRFDVALVEVGHLDPAGEAHAVALPVEAVGEDHLALRAGGDGGQVDDRAHPVAHAQVELIGVRPGKCVRLPKLHRATFCRNGAAAGDSSAELRAHDVAHVPGWIDERQVVVLVVVDVADVLVDPDEVDDLSVLKVARHVEGGRASGAAAELHSAGAVPTSTGTEVTTVFGRYSSRALRANADWLCSHCVFHCVTNSGITTVMMSS